MSGSRFAFLLLKITPAVFLVKLFLALIFGGKKLNVLVTTATKRLVQPARPLQRGEGGRRAPTLRAASHGARH